MLTDMRTIPDLVSRVYDPVSRQIVGHILEEISAYERFQDRIYQVSDHTAPMHTQDTNHNPMLGTEDRLTFVQNLRLNPDNLEWPSVYHESIFSHLDDRTLKSKCPILYHWPTGSIMTEYGQPCAITLDCQMNTSDRSFAHEFLTAIYTQFDVGDLISRFNLVFDFPVPSATYTLLYMICKMEGNDPKTFFKWLQTYSLKNIGFVTNKYDESRKQLSVRKHLTDVLTEIDCDMDQPEANVNEQSVTSYRVNFSITLQFMRPVCVYLMYPIVVNNQMIPGEAVTTDSEEQYGLPSGISPFFDEQSYRDFLASRREDTSYKQIRTIKVPWYDNWICPLESPVRQFDYFPFLSIVFTLDNWNDPDAETVIDLNDLGEDVNLDSEVLEEIKEADYNLLNFDGKYHIAVFVDDIMAEPTSLRLDEDNTTLHVPNREIHHVYRLVLSVNREILLDQFEEWRVFNIDIIVQ